MTRSKRAYGGRVNVDRYLARIGFEGTPSVDVATLTELQRRHLTSVPFENLDIALGTTEGQRVTVDASTNVDKIVEGGRGGWCFELNGAFALLLEAIGFPVIRLGAAVLLGGPSKVIDHLTLEVMVDQPYLVDVGFGDSFITPIALNRSGPHDGGTGTYELIASPQGTTLTHHVDGIPTPDYRFKRVAHTMDQFGPISNALQSDPDKHWRSKPFATRLIDGGPDRVTLTGDRLKIARHGDVVEHRVAPDTWSTTLLDWFDIRL